MTGRSVPVAVAAVLGAAFGLPALLLPARDFITFFHDDAFYYFQIARHVALGDGFTFDGIHATNGFHPLWLLVCVPIFSIFEDPVLPLRVIGLLQAALMGTSGVLLFRCLAPRLGAPAAALAPLLLAVLPGSRQCFASGMESSLLLLILVWVWKRWLALPAGGGIRAWIAPGLGCALACATRIEALLLLPCLILLGRRRLLDAPRRIVPLALPSLLTLIGLLAFNRIGFGTWLPVSGLTKARWAAQADVTWFRIALTYPWALREGICRAFGAAAVGLCPPHGRAAYLLLEALIVALAFTFRRRLVTLVRTSGTAFIFLSALAISLADVWAVTHPAPWYQGPMLLATACAAALPFTGAPRLGGILALVVAVIAGGRAAAHVAFPRDPATQYATYRVEAARWIESSTDPAARIGSWSAGMLGYFSNRAVINLDGLVNDLAYYRRVTLARDLEGYLRDEGIHLLADQACGPAPAPGVYLDRTGSEHLEPRCRLVKALYNPDSADRCPGFAIWRLGEIPGQRPLLPAANDATGNSGGSRTTSNSVATSSPSSPAR